MVIDRNGFLCTLLVFLTVGPGTAPLSAQPGGEAATDDAAAGSFTATLTSWKDMAPVELSGQAYVLHDLQRQYVNVLLCPEDPTWAVGVTSNIPRQALPAPGIQPHGYFTATVLHQPEGKAVAGIPPFFGELRLDEVSDASWAGSLSATPNAVDPDARLELSFRAVPATLERAVQAAPLTDPLRGCQAIAAPPAVATATGTASQALAELPGELREAGTATYEQNAQGLTAGQRETYDACVLDAVARVNPRVNANTDAALLRWTRIQLERSIFNCATMARS